MEKEENNPWPGFVDAFSCMLCIFIFIMLIFLLNNMLVVYESAIGGAGRTVYQKSDDLLELTNENDLSDLPEIQTENTVEEKGKAFEEGGTDIIYNNNILINMTEQSLTIEYEGNLKNYIKEDILKIIQWMKNRKNKNFEIEVFIAESNISFSDSLRLAYEKGIILMREIKSFDPGLILTLSINTHSTSLKNKAVIVPQN